MNRKTQTSPQSEARRGATEALAAVSRVISHGLDPDAVGQRIAETVRSLLRTPVAALYRLDPAGDELVVAAIAPGPTPAHLNLNRRLAKSSGLIGRALKERQAVTTANVVDDPLVTYRDIERTQVEESGWLAGIAAPLLVRGTAIGALVVRDRLGRIFDLDEIELVRTFANLAALALENTHLFGEANRRQREATELARIARTLTESLDVGEVGERIVTAVIELSGAQSAVLRRLQPDGSLVAVAVAGPERESFSQIGHVMPAGIGITHQALQAGVPLWTPDILTHPGVVLTDDLRRRTESSSTRARLAIPLRVRDVAIGALSLNSTTGRTYEPWEIEVVQAFADQAAVAFENARLFADTGRRQTEAEELARIARTLTESLELKEVGQRVVDGVLPLFQIRFARLRLLEPDGSLRLVAASGSGPDLDEPAKPLPTGQGVAWMAVTSRTPVSTTDALTDPAIVMDEPMRRVLARSEETAFLGVPLRVKHEVIGSLTIGDRTGRQFTDPEISLLQAFADQAALALDNARLYADAGRRQHEAEELAAMARLLTEHLDVETIGEQIVTRILPLFGVDSCLLRLLRPDGSLAIVAAAGGLGPHNQPPVLPRGAGMSGRAVATGEPVYYRDVQDPVTLHALPEVTRRSVEAVPERAFLALPVRAKGRPIGALVVASRTPRAFSESELALLQTFTDEAALALENARLHAETQQRLRETEALLAVSRAIGAPQDITETLRRVARETGKALNADMVGAYLPTADGAALEAAAGFQIPKEMVEEYRRCPMPLRGHALLEEAWRTRRPVWTADALRDPKVHRGWIEKFPARSVLILPMVVKETVIGALLAVWHETERVFLPAEVRLVEGIAQQAAAVVANASLYQRLTRKNEHLRVMFDTARRATQSLELDDILPTLVQSAAELVGTDASTIRLLNPERTLLEAIAHHGVSPQFMRRGAVRVGQGMSSRVLEGESVTVDDIETATAFLHAPQARAEGIRSVAMVALRSRDRSIGMLGVFSRTLRRFTADEIGLLEQFADLAAIAIENARLYGATLRREEELAALLRATRTVMGDLHLNVILDQIVEEASQMAGTPSVKVLLLDREGRRLRLAALKGAHAPPDFNVAIGESLSGVVATTGRPLFVPDSPNDPRNLLAERDRAGGIVTYLGLPIKIRDQVLGVLTFNTTYDRRYSGDELAYLSSFADQAALALQNARLYEDEQARALRLQTVARLNRVVSASLDFGEVMREITRAAATITDAPNVSVWVANNAEEAIDVQAFSNEAVGADFPIRRILFGEGGLGWIARHRQPLQVDDVTTDPRMMAAEWWQRHGMTSFLGFPIIAHDELLGIVALNGRAPFELSAADRELVQTFVAQAGVAIRNARLYEESETRRRTAEALAEVGRALAQSLDPDVVAQRIADSVRALLGARTSAVYRVDPETGDMITMAAAGHISLREGPWRIAAGTGAVGLAVREGHPITSTDVFADPRIILLPESRARIEAAGYRAVATVPLTMHDRVIGALGIGDAVGRCFSEEDVRLLQVFADQAAIALENARLYRDAEEATEDAERRRREAESLAAVGRVLVQSLDPREVARGIVQSVFRLFDAPMATVYWLDEETEALRLLAGAGDASEWIDIFPRGTGLMAVALRERQPVATPNVLTDPRVELTPVARGVLERSGHLGLLAVPLMVQSRPVGCLTVNGEPERRFTAAEIELAQLFADQAAVALVNAELYEDAQRRIARTRQLAEISQRATSTLELERVQEHVSTAALELLGGDLVRLWLVDDDGSVIRMVTERARPGQPETPDGPMELSPWEGIVGWVIRERTKRRSSQVLDDPLLACRDWVRQHGFLSQLAVPLVVGDRAIGALVVLSRTPNRFAREDEDLLETFGATAASAVQNARLYRQTQRAYEELSRAQEQLTQSQKMEAIGRLAGGIAHDFNNLLTVISGRAQLLLNRLWPDDPLRRHVDLVLKTSDRASGLTRQLLAFSRKQVFQLRVLDLNEVVTNMSTMLRRLIGEDIRLMTVLTPGLGRVKADPGQIEQVIMNLAVNARDAMPNGGTLTIETADADVGEATTAIRGNMGPGAYVVLAVTDNGVGMDAETRARIFEPFFTTKERGKGTGLGLSTVYGIVQQSNGAIWVYSEPGHGSSFKIYLPRVDELAERLETTTALPAVPHGTETVLLVEDEDEVRSLAQEILEETGYTVLAADGGTEAVARSREHRGPIDLLLTDVIMPGMSGPEVVNHVLALRPTVKVLYMSGYTDDAIVHHGVLEPGTAYLQKPFAPDALSRKIREVLDGRVVEER